VTDSTPSGVRRHRQTGGLPALIVSADSGIVANHIRS